MNASLASRPVYLSHYLQLFEPYLQRSDVTDIYVNRPQEVWLETQGGAIERHEVEPLDAALLDRFARQVAAQAHQGINREHPLLSASLPDGSRIQIIVPPATRGALALAIRKHQALDLRLEDYNAAYAFDAVHRRDDGQNIDAVLCRLRDEGKFTHLLREAVRARKNILVSGGTSTGKTTFLNTLIREIPEDERLILIEDAPEIALHHTNAIGLIAARSSLGESAMTADDLLNASLRMRPDRIILGELRGPEAFTFLRAINTGHPGSMTTIHADSPARAIEQIALLVLQTGTQLTHDDIVRYVRSTVDIFVQLGRSGGRRHVLDIGVKEDLS
ncbi:P-type DNA transfer ATPase VirB11 [Rhizorhapis suberifaciens]|uniref:Type IV secretion system protein n=1 Tax=Rhizorhapis suberifaciens TaxID=13656 RepID=A0A840HYV8_9SPHN|nr:P-type DNA transfer ATPase VirB11 [Rhizorhapis suberifaciens]MBB4642584.1 type IV secretion system protein VirB11 [Rhizorhapis suberifaciens]